MLRALLAVSEQVEFFQLTGLLQTKCISYLLSLDLLLITVVFDQQINNVILPSLIMGYLDKNIGKVRLLFVTFYLINNDWDNI